jgi:oligopeptide transport system permease protein
MLLLAERDGRSELNAEEQAELAEIQDRVENERRVIDGEEVLVHQRRYLLGTDHLGRDMFARILYGGQISIAIGLIGTITSVFIGIVLGSIAGYIGGKTDYFIMRFVDVMYGLPYMLVVIILMAIFGRNIFNLFLALSLVSWLVVARVVRGQIMSLKNSEFVEAARSMGASQTRIIFRHLIPNTAGIIIVFATLRIPAFIMQESFLSYLGLGISAPFASWGSLVSEGVDRMTSTPWQLFFPAMAMTLFLFAMNFLGDGLRDAFDPHSKNRL